VKAIETLNSWKLNSPENPPALRQSPERFQRSITSTTSCFLPIILLDEMFFPKLLIQVRSKVKTTQVDAKVSRKHQQ
jgi:hypothetical protein